MAEVLIYRAQLDPPHRVECGLDEDCTCGAQERVEVLESENAREIHDFVDRCMGSIAVSGVITITARWASMAELDVTRPIVTGGPTVKAHLE